MDLLETILQILGKLDGTPLPNIRKNWRIYAAFFVTLIIALLADKFFPDGFIHWTILALIAFVWLVVIVIATHKP